MSHNQDRTVRSHRKTENQGSRQTCQESRSASGQQSDALTSNSKKAGTVKSKPNRKIYLRKPRRIISRMLIVYDQPPKPETNKITQNNEERQLNHC